MKTHPNEDVWGTTSAYAENTLVILFHNLRLGNYLRVRGEYQKTISPN